MTGDLVGEEHFKFFCIIYNLDYTTSQYLFDCSHTTISNAFCAVRNLLSDRARGQLKPNVAWIADNMEPLVRSIQQVTGRKTNCFAFIDGTFRPMCRYDELFFKE